MGKRIARQNRLIFNENALLNNRTTKYHDKVTDDLTKKIKGLEQKLKTDNAKRELERKQHIFHQDYLRSQQSALGKVIGVKLLNPVALSAEQLKQVKASAL